MQTYMHSVIFHFSDPKVYASVGLDFDFRNFIVSSTTFLWQYLKEMKKHNFL